MAFGRYGDRRLVIESLHTVSSHILTARSFVNFTIRIRLRLSTVTLRSYCFRNLRRTILRTAVIRSNAPLRMHIRLRTRRTHIRLRLLTLLTRLRRRWRRHRIPGLMRESITLNGTRSSGIVILNDTCIHRDVIRARRFRLDINAAIFRRC